nr:eukaryotic translation initiation factor 3 subunit L-like [Populus alba]
MLRKQKFEPDPKEDKHTDSKNRSANDSGRYQSGSKKTGDEQAKNRRRKQGGRRQKQKNTEEVRKTKQGEDGQSGAQNRGNTEEGGINRERLRGGGERAGKTKTKEIKKARTIGVDEKQKQSGVTLASHHFRLRQHLNQEGGPVYDFQDSNNYVRDIEPVR